MTGQERLPGNPDGYMPDGLRKQAMATLGSLVDGQGTPGWHAVQAAVETSYRAGYMQAVTDLTMKRAVKDREIAKAAADLAALIDETGGE